MKVVSVVGARPQFIKASIVSREIKKTYDDVLIHTGQHYDFEMSQIFFDQLRISEPDYNLGIGSAPQGEQTAKILIKIEPVLVKEKPDIVLVYGDTNSTLAGALAAVKLHIPVGHVEAGLRSFDKTMPEEINRILTDHASDLLFAPTKTAVDNLKKEGITDGVHLVGDVMYDTLLENKHIAEKSKILEKLNMQPKEYLLLTIHRQSNTDNIENLSNILRGLGEMGTPVLFPIHPRTLKALQQKGLDKKMPHHMHLIKPVGYVDFLWLEKNAQKILTDSGGVQKEAYMLQIPCITLRDNTEWIETVQDGWNVLVGSSKEKIIDAIYNFNPKGKQGIIFGDGKASKKITTLLVEFFNKNHK